MSESHDIDDVPLEDSRDANPVNRIPNAADDVAIGKAKQKAKHLADKRQDFWKRVLSEDVGRAVMWEVLTGMHTFEERFAISPAGFPDPNATFFQAGEKAAGWRLYDALRKADFEGVQLMHTECDPYFIEKSKKGK